MKTALEQLINLSLSWASGANVDLNEALRLRHMALSLRHIHYLEKISVYKKLAREEGCTESADITDIKRRLMLDAGIFKSYEQSWLDTNNYSSMNRWLSSIFHRRVDVDVAGVSDIDAWIDRLAADGIHVVYSSGTSGTFSFIPRELNDWKLSREFNTGYLTPLLAEIIGGTYAKKLLKLAPCFSRRGFAGYNAAFLGFRQGRMGNQALIPELASLFPNCHYLYDIAVTGSALRALRRGPRTDEELQRAEELKRTIITGQEEHYLRLVNFLKESTSAGQKVFIFGAPYQLLELCSIMTYRQQLVLQKGSVILIGGGWKSFTGEAIGRQKLLEMISGTFSVPYSRVLEGYSMTEINTLMLRCRYGRFHIPPVIEPVIFNDSLEPLEGRELTGTFGFLDTLAASYPGFIISGDRVHMVEDRCECGLEGPAILDIERISGMEVKGCGGIMSSLAV